MSIICSKKERNKGGNKQIRMYSKNRGKEKIRGIDTRWV